MNLNAAVSTETGDIIATWQEAKARAAAAKEECNLACVELTDITNALGREITPADAKNRDKFIVWMGDNFLEVTVVGNRDAFKIEEREGKR